MSTYTGAGLFDMRSLGTSTLAAIHAAIRPIHGEPEDRLYVMAERILRERGIDTTTQPNTQHIGEVKVK